MKVRVGFVAGVVALALLVSCNAVLGVEELHSGPRDGESGAAGTIDGALGGAKNVAGERSFGGSSGRPPLTGGTQPNGGTEGSPFEPHGGDGSGNSPDGGTDSVGLAGRGDGGRAGRGGDGGRGGALVVEGGTGNVAGFDRGAAGDDDGGSGGSAGAVDPAGDTVTGKIVNAWGYPLEGVSVSVSGVAERAVTGPDGTFTVSGVTAPYDVWFVVRATTKTVSNLLSTQGWFYRGVRRMAPTFRVNRGGREVDTRVGILQTGAPNDPELKFRTTLGTPHGLRSGGLVLEGSLTLNGPDSASGTAHLLSLKFDATGLPTSYSTYTADAMEARSDAVTTKTFDMTPAAPPISTGRVTGTVVGSGSSRENFAWLRFPSNGAIELANVVNPASADFAYTVPEIAGATVTVAASAGDKDWGPYAIVHGNGLESGDDVTLALPSPSTWLAPENGAAIDASTTYSWTNDAPVSLLVLQGPQRYIFVVTGEDSTTVPSALFSEIAFPADGWFEFSVETHGDIASVDDAAGPSGFLDELSSDRDRPTHPESGDGYFTLSEVREGYIQ